MTDVQLVWPNKDRPLRASGLTGYEWLEATDKRLTEVAKFTQITDGHISSDSNVLAVGDGLEVIEALSARSTALSGGIRLGFV